MFSSRLMFICAYILEFYCGFNSIFFVSVIKYKQYACKNNNYFKIMIFLKSNKHIKEKNGRLSEIPRGVAMSLGIKLVWGGNRPKWNHVITMEEDEYRWRMDRMRLTTLLFYYK